MQSEPFVVIGGGISGILAALLLSKQYKNITLVERGEKIGGLLTSQLVEGNYFDYGTHMLQETLIPEIDQLLYDSCYDAKLYNQYEIFTGGTYFNGKLYDDSPILNLNDLSDTIKLKGFTELLELKNQTCHKDDLTLIEYMKKVKFGDVITEILCPILKYKFETPLDELHPFALSQFGLNRIKLLSKKSAEILKEDLFFNDRLGYHSYKHKVGNHSFFYPKKSGLIQWVNQLEKKLVHQGVKIMTSKQIKRLDIKNKNVRNIEFNDGEILPCLNLFWACPFEIFSALASPNKNRVLPNFLLTTLVHFNLSKPFLTNLQCITNYDPNKYLFRVTLYPNLTQDYSNNFSCTVEILHKQRNLPENLVAYIFNELIDMGIVSKDSEILFSYVNRPVRSFPILSKKFMDNLKKSENEMKEFNNVQFFGKGISQKFFMGDILVDVYEKIKAGFLFKDVVESEKRYV